MRTQQHAMRLTDSQDQAVETTAVKSQPPCEIPINNFTNMRCTSQYYWQQPDASIMTGQP
jgi:hypothetical protein